ncbi:HEPN domain-containing protein [Lachnospiraceae bacterium MD335]|nr:HEPN domain-containing protein [Lachnospiraceae bacterium MD335]
MCLIFLRNYCNNIEFKLLLWYDNEKLFGGLFMKHKEINYTVMLKAADDNWCAAEIIRKAEKLYYPFSILLALSGEIYLKYILLIKCGRIGIKTHDLLRLYKMLSEEVQNEINDIIVNQPKEFQSILFEGYTLSHYIEELEKNSSLFINSRYYYENYQKELFKYFGGIYETIKAFRTYAHKCAINNERTDL